MNLASPSRLDFFRFEAGVPWLRTEEGVEDSSDLIRVFKNYTSAILANAHNSHRMSLS